jgi:nitrate reductase NapAB chaperone NapD
MGARVVTTALVVTLARETAPEAVAALVRESRVTLGSAAHGRLPLVIETHDEEEAEELVRAIGEVAGVAHVDVVRIDFFTDEETW